MHSYLRVLSIAFASTALVACAKSSSTNTPPPQAKVEPPPAKTEFQEVVASAALKTVRTGERLTGLQNPLFLKGEGKGASYKAIYRFNSGTHSAFKLLALEQKTKCVGGKAPSPKILLSHEGQSVEVNTLSLIGLTTNTDYELSLVIDKHDCEEMDLDFKVTAWADHVDPKSAQPEIARSCRGRAPRQLVFFLQKQPFVAYSSNTAQPLFLNIRTFCGVRTGASEMSCSQTFAPEPMSLSCTAATRPESKMTVRFTADQKNASVVCQKGAVQSFNGAYTDCFDQILDWNEFQQRLKTGRL